MTDTVYDMMIRLGLDHSIVLSGLGAIGASLARLGRQAEHTKMALMGIGELAFAGALTVGIGKVVDALKPLTSELVNVKNLNGEIARIAANGELTRQAYELSKTVPMDVQDLIKLRRHAWGLMDTETDISKSQALWEPLAKYAFSKGLTGDEGMSRVLTMLKAGENAGQLTNEKGEFDMGLAKRWIDLSARLTAGSGGLIKEGDIGGLARQGGFTMRHLSDEGVYTLGMLTETLGGPRVGTAFLSTWQQYQQSRMATRKIAEAMQNIGLLKEGEWSFEKGKGVTIEPNARRRLSGDLMRDPLSIAQQLDRNLTEMGVTDDEERLNMIASALGRQTSMRLGAEEYANRAQILRRQKTFAAVAGNEEQFQNRLSGDIESNVKGLTAAWNNLLRAIGGENGENVIHWLQSLTHTIQDITEKVRALPPGTIENIGKGIAELALVMAVAGAGSLLLAIGPAGWLIAGLAALVGLNWGRMQGFMDWILKGMAASTPEALAEQERLKKQSLKDVPTLSDLAGEAADAIRRKLTTPIVPGPTAPYSFDPNIKQQSFVTGGGNAKQILQPIMIKLDLDGRMLGKAVSDILEDLFSHPEQAPTGNAINAYNAPGNRYS